MSKKLKLSETQELRRRLFDNLMLNYFDIAVNMIKWKNLPNELSSTRIEAFLYDKGVCGFADDIDLSYLTLPIAQNYGINIYGEPVSWSLIGYNYNKHYNVDNSVLIRNNRSRTPTRPFIEHYVNMITNIEMTIMLNLNAQKTPFVFSGNENELLSFKNLWAQIMGCEPAIYKDNKLVESAFKVMPTQSTYISDKLMELRNDYDSKILTFIGLNNNNITKRERLIVDEVNANNEFINANAYSRLTARQKDAEKINKMFGLNIEPIINEDIKNIFERREQNGEIYT